VRKRPEQNEFRVQPEYGGTIAAAQPSAQELAAAQAVLAAVEEPLLYARIDLVRGEDGSPQLIELEAIEPDLYLDYDPKHGEAFAQAALSAAGG
jgi:hypothetical protein